MRYVLQLFSIGALLCQTAFSGALSPEQILSKSDRARGGVSQGLSWKLSMHAEENGSTSDASYEVQVKGVNVLARCVAPPRQKDDTFLFNDRNLWVYKTGLRKPVSLSPRQRLSGQAANGDIATTNYARDYTATLVGTESVNGVPCYKLHLQAKSKDVTYDAIDYWVTQDRLLGIQASFLTLEGKVFKNAEFKYENTIALGSEKAPFVSQMTIVDAIFPQNKTTLVYENPKPAQIADSAFNVNNLAR